MIAFFEISNSHSIRCDWRARIACGAATFALSWALGTGALPAPAHAAVADVRGSIAIGYAKLFTSDAPSGSMSAAAGLSYPVLPNLSLGPSIAFHLLGSRTVERGSLIASVDYSAFEAGVLAHWRPEGWGPVGLVSFGPEVLSARAELSTTGGGAAFSDLALQKSAPALALDITLIKSREAPVRVGLELSGHWAMLHGSEDWTLLGARLCFRY
jgi:hypothetical protein